MEYQFTEEDLQFVEDIVSKVPEVCQIPEKTKSDDFYIANATPVKGYDFNNGLDYDKLFEAFKHTGVQATSLGKSIDIVNDMIKWRLSEEEVTENEQDEYLNHEVREKTR
jgi:hypothetical protein